MATRTIRDQGGKARPGLTSEQVWQAVARASFAVLSHVTPAGEPRSSGVMYKTSGRRLLVAVAPRRVPARARRISCSAWQYGWRLVRLRLPPFAARERPSEADGAGVAASPIGSQSLRRLGRQLADPCRPVRERGPHAWAVACAGAGAEQVVTGAAGEERAAPVGVVAAVGDV